MLYFSQLILLMLFATFIWANYICSNIYYTTAYFVYNHIQSIYYIIFVIYMCGCFVHQGCVASAGGNELVYSHVLAYNNMVTRGFQLQGLSLHYLHEANQYLSTLEWLGVQRQQNTYWNNCWLVPIKKNDNILGGADSILVNASTNHICNIQFKTFTEYNFLTLNELSVTYKGVSDVLFITVPNQELHTLVSEHFSTYKPHMNVVVSVHEEKINYEIWEQLVREHAKWLSLNQRVIIELYNRNPHKAHDMLEEIGEEQPCFAHTVLQTLAQTQWVIKNSEQ